VPFSGIVELSLGCSEIAAPARSVPFVSPGPAAPVLLLYLTAQNALAPRSEGMLALDCGLAHLCAVGRVGVADAAK
jgi:hypothetical protein